MSSFSYPFLTLPGAQAADTGVTIENIIPAETSADIYSKSAFAYTQAAGSRLNQQYIEGWNVATNGQPLDTTRSSIGVTVESHFEPDVSHIYKEWYVQYYPPNSLTYQRPFSVGINEVDGSIAVQLQYTTLNLIDAAGTIVGGFNTGSTNPAAFFYGSANFSSILQLANAANVNSYSWRFQIPNSSGSAARAGNLELLDATGNPVLTLRQDKIVGVGYGNYNPGNSATLDVWDGTASTGATKFSIRAGAGQSTSNLEEVKDGGGNIIWSVNQYAPKLRSVAVASLPSASNAGSGAMMFASNGRKSGEGVGAGTGIPVWSDGTNWRTYYDNTIAAA